MIRFFAWPPIRRRLLIAILALGTLVAGFLAFLIPRVFREKQSYTTAIASRSDMSEIVGATGTLEAVVTVQVGSQVSGIIDSLSADFNSTVRKGAIIARLDPSSFDARLSQARANLVVARANADKARAALEDARLKFNRARELAAEKLLPQTELDTARTNFVSAQAQLRASEASVTQAVASVNQSDVDLNHTIIRAPIDGIVIARNVDVGQTVAASLQAPTLFIIANDLSRMRVNASIDESDVGRVFQGQPVTFRVDAYPDRVFSGQVEQVRLQPMNVQNVVTYNTIIAVNNPRQLLKPGMTATVSLIVAQSQNAVCVPAAALRFRPEGWSSESASAAAIRERDRSMRSSEGSTSASSQRSGRRGSRPTDGAQRPVGDASTESERSTAASSDSARSRERHGRVFMLNTGGQPTPVEVTIGISDGRLVEIKSGIEEGAVVITGLHQNGRSPSPAASATPNNPFAPSRQIRQR